MRDDLAKRLFFDVWMRRKADGIHVLRDIALAGRLPSIYPYTGRSYPKSCETGMPPSNVIRLRVIQRALVREQSLLDEPKGLKSSLVPFSSFKPLYQ